MVSALSVLALLRLDLPLCRLGPAWGCHCSPCSAWSGFVWQLERAKIWEVIRPWDQPPKRYRNYFEPGSAWVGVRSRGALQRFREAYQRCFQDHLSWARWTRWRRLRMARCALTMPKALEEMLEKLFENPGCTVGSAPNQNAPATSI